MAFLVVLETEEVGFNAACYLIEGQEDADHLEELVPVDAWWLGETNPLAIISHMATLAHHAWGD